MGFLTSIITFFKGVPAIAKLGEKYFGWKLATIKMKDREHKEKIDVREKKNEAKELKLDNKIDKLEHKTEDKAERRDKREERRDKRAKK